MSHYMVPRAYRRLNKPLVPYSGTFIIAQYWQVRKGSFRATLSKSAPECPAADGAVQLWSHIFLVFCFSFFPCYTGGRDVMKVATRLYMYMYMYLYFPPTVDLPEKSIYWAEERPSRVELGFKQECNTNDSHYLHNMTSEHRNEYMYMYMYM